MGSGYRNIFVRFEYCASPLCPFDLLPAPKMVENERSANYPTANHRYPAVPAVCLQHAGSISPWLRGRCCHGVGAVRARCKHWVYLGPLPVIIATIKRLPGKNKNYPEAFGNYWQPQKGGGVLATKVFWGFMGCYGNSWATNEHEGRRTSEMQ